MLSWERQVPLAEIFLQGLPQLWISHLFLTALKLILMEKK